MESAESKQTTLALSPAEVHLWLAFQHASPHVARLGEYAALLSAAEHEQEARFYFERDRVRYRVTRAMVRRVLSGYLGIAPADCHFQNNAHGRPHLTNAEASRDKLNFNVSHTQDLILLGVTRGRELGVDVERVTDKRASANLATRYFAAAESERILEAPAGERDDLFCQYWTLKESYIKARGFGLAIPLGKFGFELDGGTVKLWTDPVLGDDANRWSFTQLRPTEAHHAALCVERSGEPVSLAVRDFADFSLAPELPRG